MNAATEVKRHKLTQTDCDMAKYLLEHGQTLKEIAVIIKCDPSTVGKIRLANYDLPTYLSQRKEMNRKTKENKRAALRKMEELEDREATMAGVKPMKRWPDLSKVFPPVAEEAQEVPGQMKMNLEPEKDPSPAAQDDTKSMMRFQAAMMDKLLNKLDELIVVLRGGAEA